MIISSVFIILLVLVINISMITYKGNHQSKVIIGQRLCDVTQTLCTVSIEATSGTWVLNHNISNNFIIVHQVSSVDSFKLEISS